ncbi:lysophospholipid acyltransferase family protein [Calycomorphotria hydatis]|uniref:DUF374 domain-containing protein n=1 Tax=Calycomorphotria hydatis TaxID=2528027 RepID=A0A517TFC0_9PLAN|nr:lysophospholipid acyltransferase family protein [Calycomorphotria hydatis]QDT67073.1 hypothetical protein V22_43460 [Calycomorphotria hydatis]
MKIRNKFLNKCLAYTAAIALRAIVRTCRLEAIEEEADTNIYNPDTKGRYLISFWHDQIAMYVFIRPHYDVGGLVSQHRDGEYLADGMRAVDVTPVRGSSKRGGAEAVTQIMRDAQGLHIAITPDGPRGPEHKMKQGIVYLASRMQRPILPTYAVCESAWRIKGSWTDLIIPKPFSRVIMVGAPLFHVPAEVPKNELQGYVEQVEAEMSRLEQKAHAILNGEPIEELTKLPMAA